MIGVVRVFETERADGVGVGVWSNDVEVVSKEGGSVDSKLGK